MSEVTQILEAIDKGDPRAADQLLPLVYDELRKLAAKKLAHETPGQTLDPTGLVHEAYLRLVGAAAKEPPQFANCRHFLSAAAEAMRRILVENARRKRRHKHGGGRQRIELLDDHHRTLFANDDILAVNESVEALEQADPQVATLVKLHVFAGLALKEVAQALGRSERTIYRDWSYARAWLSRYLKPTGSSRKKS